MNMSPIAPHLAVHHPELVVLELLQHALIAARSALAGPHPEVNARGCLGDVDHTCHVALLITVHLDALHTLLLRYRLAVDGVDLD